MEIRTITIKDIPQIRLVEKEYYEGFSCPKETLRCWIEQLPDNFLVAEEDNQIIAFLFFEYLYEEKVLPFIHDPIKNRRGDCVYVSEIGVLDKYKDSEVLQELFEEMVEKARLDGCKKIIWLTGEKSKHDKIELAILTKNRFFKGKPVQNWECYPGKFVDDHVVYERALL